MIFLLLAVASSAAMALVLKAFRAGRGNRYGILLGNYLTCVLISFLTLPEKGMILSGSRATLVCGAVGGLFFVAALVCMQTSIRHSGATLTAAFARLGLVVCLGVSILAFSERPGGLQIVGICLALAAIVLLAPGGQRSGRRTAGGLGLLLLTLLCSGGADVMAKVFDRCCPAREGSLYFFFLFSAATVLCLGLLILERVRTGKGVDPREFASGILVGLPNFYSSYLLLRALQNLPATVAYPTYSAGTILLVMLLSALLFKERLQKRQIPGMVLLFAALILLNL